MALSFLLSLVVALLAFGVFYPLYIEISYFDTDFLDYCISVIAVDERRIPVPFKRSQIAALLPFALGRILGVVDALILSSLLCFAGIFAVCGRYVALLDRRWRWQLLLAVIFLCQAPMVAMTKMVNFYGEIVFLCTLGTYLVARAVKLSSKEAILSGYAGVALCWLADARGMLWGLCLLAVLILSIRKSGGWKGARWHLLCFLGTHVLSWKAGSFAYHKNSSPLTRQIDVRPLFQKVDSENPLYALPHDHPPDFVWGFGELIDLPETLLFLINQALLPVPDAFLSSVSSSVGIHSAWLFWMIAAVVSMIALLWKKPDSIQLILPMCASLLAFWKIESMVEPHLRFFQQGLPVISVLIVCAIIAWADRWDSVLTWKVGALGALSLPVIAVMSSPQWSVSRLILNNHLAASFPEHSSKINSLQVQVGQQIHLYVLPMTDRERRMTRNWAKICEERLTQDGKPLPFVTEVFNEQK